MTQEVAWVVTPEKAECKINGAVVASFPKAELVGAGKLESLDGIAGIRVGAQRRRERHQLQGHEVDDSSRPSSVGGGPGL